MNDEDMKLRQEARSAVTCAKRSGRLVVQPCERCGTTSGVDAHHEDYTKPLDVRWLCKAHHRERHVELGTPIGRPRDPRLAPKSESVGLRVHSEESTEWERAANYEGVKLQTWIRAACNAAAATSAAARNTASAAANSTPPRRPRSR